MMRPRSDHDNRLTVTSSGLTDVHGDIFLLRCGDAQETTNYSGFFGSFYEPYAAIDCARMLATVLPSFRYLASPISQLLLDRSDWSPAYEHLVQISVITEKSCKRFLDLNTVKTFPAMGGTLALVFHPSSQLPPRILAKMTEIGTALLYAMHLTHRYCLDLSPIFWQPGSPPGPRRSETDDRETIVTEYHISRIRSLWGVSS